MYSLDARLYVELIPDKAACDKLSELCKKLSLHLNGRAVDPAKWHVTVIHFGVAEHVYYDILRDQPILSRSTFLEAFAQYIDRAKQHLPSPTALQPLELELLGLNENVLALTFEPNEVVTAAHDAALKDVTFFLSQCGIPDPEAFMKGSINFRWALELKPHITLFRSVRNAQLAGIDIPKEPMSFSSAGIHGL